MFTFSGHIDSRHFLRASLLRLALFVASVVVCPLILSGILVVSGCQRVGGACGAMGLIVATAYKPLATALLIFSFVGISLRRVRDVGGPAWMGLFIPLLFAADQTMLTVVGAPWTLGFTMGVLFGRVPVYALLALWCIAILCVLPSGSGRGGFGMPGRIAFGLGAAVAFFAGVQALGAFPGLSGVLFPLMLAMGPLLRFVDVAIPCLMAALAILLGFIAWTAWRSEPALAAELPPQDERAQRPLAVRGSSLVIVALAATLAAYVATIGQDLPGGLWLIGLATQLTTTLLPTFLLYLALLWALVWHATARTRGSLALLTLAAAPFLHWAYAHWSAARESAREAAEIAAVPTVRPSRVPPVLVFESSSTTGMSAAWTVPGVEKVISKGAYTPSLMQFTRVDGGRRRQETALAALPGEYLLLKVGRASAFAKKGQVYGAMGGPYELRLVSDARDDLIAVSYRAFNPRPGLLPVLTTSGWYRGSNSATTDQIAASVEAFLGTALGHLRSAGAPAPRLRG